MNTCMDISNGKEWTLYHGDCVEVMQNMPENSIDYSVYSPPFANMFTYSSSERDMGNVASDEEFFDQFRYLVQEHWRTHCPGRLISVHAMNLPSTMQSHGYIGIRDFRGDIIREFIDDEAADFHRYTVRIQRRLLEAFADGDERRKFRLTNILESHAEEMREHSAGSKKFVYHSEVCIWKNPVTAMCRTKALGLLHKQIVKDSSRSRQGIADYVITFKKPGDNENPVSGPFERWIGDDSFENKGNYSIDVWQRYASPVWMDIDQSRTLNARLAKDESDTKHLCPLQLDVIERCLELWSNPGDVVLSPYAGVGSEGVVSVDAGRKFVGIELKDTYFREAANFLRQAEATASTPSLLDCLEN